MWVIWVLVTTIWFILKMTLKFNAALGRLANDRFIDKQELLSKETPEPVVD